MRALIWPEAASPFSTVNVASVLAALPRFHPSRPSSKLGFAKKFWGAAKAGAAKPTATMRAVSILDSMNCLLCVAGCRN